MSGAPLIALMGVICVATLFIGLGFVFPVSSGVGDLFDFLAVASGMFCIGLLDDGKPDRPMVRELDPRISSASIRMPLYSGARAHALGRDGSERRRAARPCAGRHAAREASPPPSAEAANRQPRA